MHIGLRHLTLSDSFTSCAIALLLDFCIGDPPGFPHPVRGIGWLVERLEGRLYGNSHRLLSGCILVVLTVLIACLCAYLTLWIAGAINRYAQLAVAAVLIWTAVAVRDLYDHAQRVRLALEQGDLAKARLKLSAMVSRDTASLDENGIARGCVESIAENLVDGVVSPLFFALLGGPVLAYAFKAISTLDSMVGYRNERYRDFGSASARADDVFNYLPARLSFVTLPLAALLGQNNSLECLKTMFRDGGKNPSPNSGIPEAGFAGALGIQLGGPNMYAGTLVVKPLINQEGRPATIHDIRRAQILLYSASIVSFCFFSLLFFLLLGPIASLR